MKHVKKTYYCFVMIEAEMVKKNIKKINVVNKIQSSRNLVNLEGSSQHFANMDMVTDGIGQLIGKHIITVPALVELTGLKICRNNLTDE